MPDFDIVFEKLHLAIAEEHPQHPVERPELVKEELDEIEELRRYAAEMQEPPPASFTIT